MRMICGLKYRNIAGYLEISGPNQLNAQHRVKRVRAALQDRLPEGTTVKPGRYVGFRHNSYVYEIPVLLNRPGVRPALNQIFLRGEP